MYWKNTANYVTITLIDILFYSFGIWFFWNCILADSFLFIGEILFTQSMAIVFGIFLIIHIVCIFTRSLLIYLRKSHE